MMGSYPGKYTFHPKVYVFEGARSTTAIVGSANLTAGGLSQNHEISLVVTQDAPVLAREVDRWVRSLERDKHIVRITLERIEAYRARHAIHRAQENLAQRRIKRAVSSDGAQYETLQDILQEMKRDTSGEGFSSQRKDRAANRRRALTLLKVIANDRDLTKSTFLQRYEQLIGLWHSGGLHRGKTRIRNCFKDFQRALRLVLQAEFRSARHAFETVHRALEPVVGAGTNVMTEILHTLDNSRFPVMNQNSVAGLYLASISGFPKKPNRLNVTADSYSQFSTKADEVRVQLGLADLTELDALFNYAYWPRDDEEGEEGEEDE